MPVLKLETVSHHFGRVRALDEVTLAVDRGELVCLLGPSGCGKTTALRVAAGLERLQAGRVLIDDQPVADERRDVPPEDRSVGLVFQDYALFPHLDVKGNVAFGLRGWPRKQREERAMAVLRQVGMGHLAESHPHMLSGGQQQRVALARALAPNPKVMLLDEPFSGLDVTLRHTVRDETLHVLKRAGSATLMVTHDPEEAMFMADRIALMRDGRIVQLGPPAELYARPADKFVASFFGDINRLFGVVRQASVQTPFGPLDAAGYAEGTEVEILIRPEALQLETASAAPDQRSPGQRPARVTEARLLGRSSMIHLAVDGTAAYCAGDCGDVHLRARMPGNFLPQPDAQLDVRLDRSQTFVFPADHVT